MYLSESLIQLPSLVLSSAVRLLKRRTPFSMEKTAAISAVQSPSLSTCISGSTCRKGRYGTRHRSLTYCIAGWPRLPDPALSSTLVTLIDDRRWLN